MIKHPPKEEQLSIVDKKTQLPMFYTDVYMSYTIGEVVRYWTKEMLKNNIPIKKIITVNGIVDKTYYRPYYKEFPWSVDIIHMNFIKNSEYKINFNLTDGEHEYYDKNNPFIYRICNYNYVITDEQNNFLDNFFKGDWLKYVDKQGSRIIVEFDLDKYYLSWFRTIKLNKIKNNIIEKVAD